LLNILGSAHGGLQLQNTLPIAPFGGSSVGYSCILTTYRKL
jgi:hypothetical protein